MDPTSEQWLALHHAFWRYCEVKLRERLANEDILRVPCCNLPADLARRRRRSPSTSLWRGYHSLCPTGLERIKATPPLSGSSHPLLPRGGQILSVDLGLAFTTGVLPLAQVVIVDLHAVVVSNDLHGHRGILWQGSTARVCCIPIPLDDRVYYWHHNLPGICTYEHSNRVEGKVDLISKARHGWDQLHGNACFSLDFGDSIINVSAEVIVYEPAETHFFREMNFYRIVVKHGNSKMGRINATAKPYSGIVYCQSLNFKRNPLTCLLGFNSMMPHIDAFGESLEEAT